MPLIPKTFPGRHGDVILMPLTSRNQGDAVLAVRHWENAGLLKPTWFKPMVTLSASQIDRRLGRLLPTDVGRAGKALRKIIDPRFLG